MSTAILLILIIVSIQPRLLPPHQLRLPQKLSKTLRRRLFGLRLRLQQVLHTALQALEHGGSWPCRHRDFRLAGPEPTTLLAESG